MLKVTNTVLSVNPLLILFDAKHYSSFKVVFKLPELLSKLFLHFVHEV